MVDSLNILSLCSGVGMLDEGLALGASYLGWRPRVVAYAERESYAATVLLARMADASLERAPVWCGDFADLDADSLRGHVDCVVAGFPCQPWSNAGQRSGIDDERWLWPAIANIIDRVQPELVFLENVAGLVSGCGLNHVLDALAQRGFDAEWTNLQAAAVGAAHERERVFILAYRHGCQFTRQLADEREPINGTDGRHDAIGSGERMAVSSMRGFGKLRQSSGRDGLSDGGDKELGHSPRVDVRKRKRQRQRAAVGTGSESRPEGSSENVGDTESIAGRRGLGELRRASRRDEPEVAGVELVNAGSERASEPRESGERQSEQQSRRTSEPSRRCEHVGNTRLARLPLAECDQLPGAERHNEGRAVGESDRAPIFAPGPTADWGRIPAHLYPATESGVRVLADGLALVLDESRADQLRCGGNGVVALQAAAAFVGLMRRANLA